MSHITDQEWRSYHSHTMTSTEELSLMKHISQCPFCAGRLASTFPEEELITPPADFKEQILLSAKRMEPRFRKKQRQREFYLYCTKVVLAASLAIFMIFSTSLTAKQPIVSGYITETIEKKNISNHLYQSSSKISRYLTHFSGNICDTLHSADNQNK